ncbi:exonuclease i/din7p-like [Cryptosporidium canis]|uniref:Exonuclease 1 n=1 Tax=Cryptosporidium canis TaxID=195482 RepID=A0ABQ8PBI6_9CRYT|nr:exonuclease i/din7p-like [Cryptosporidium canis]KAJ1615233.1 exonuclease i/din7p-like [Cryptosporidium canis]
MGIQGLLPSVDSVSKWCKIDVFKGRRVAIDTYGWLHRSVANCAENIVLGKPTRAHINYCVDRIKTLQEKGIIPVCVFDGATLPMKKVTEEERRKKRDDAKKEIIRLKAKKTHSSYTMKNLFQKALDITPSIAQQVLEVLRDEYKVECIVAPYEADAQLSYLSRTNYVDAVITEDSDMLVFGSICTVYKYDDKTGHCKVIYWKDLYKSGIISQFLFSYETFVLGCILTGCDYVKSPQGVGIKTAMRLVQDCNADLERIILQLKELGKNVPISYSTDVQKAIITFFHQTVFDPLEGKMVPLSNSGIPKSSIEANTFLAGMPKFIEFDNQIRQGSITDNEMKNCIGPIIEGKTATDICLGFIHPETHIKYTNLRNCILKSAVIECQVKGKLAVDPLEDPKICLEKENICHNKEKKDCDVEELIKQSIKSPPHVKGSNIQLLPNIESHRNKRKRRRTLWLNSKIDSGNMAYKNIQSLDSLAFQAR